MGIIFAANLLTGAKQISSSK